MIGFNWLAAGLFLLIIGCAAGFAVFVSFFEPRTQIKIMAGYIVACAVVLGFLVEAVR